MSTALAPIDNVIAELRTDAFKKQIADALPGNVTPDRFVRVSMTALRDNAEELLKTNRASLFGAIVRCAQDGLLPDGHEAAIVRFGDKAAYMPMIGGFRKIAAEYGWTLITRVVYANDEFEHVLGLQENIVHVPARPGVDRGNLYAAYAIGRHRDGRPPLLEVMYGPDIEKVRQVSRAKDRGPWKDWTERMWEKSAGRRLFAKLPLDGADKERIARVIEASSLENGDAARMLYGDAERPALERPPAADTPAEARADDVDGQAPAADGDQQAAADAAEGDSSSRTEAEAAAPDPDQPDESIEPSTEEVLASAAGMFVFASGKNAGATIEHVWNQGDEGRGYIKWAATNHPNDAIKKACSEWLAFHETTVPA